MLGNTNKALDFFLMMMDTKGKKRVAIEMSRYSTFFLLINLIHTVFLVILEPEKKYWYMS
jgi:hypothetical protein